jgi:penicillin-binding protein 1A
MAGTRSRSARRATTTARPAKRSLIWRGRRMFLLLFVVMVTAASGFAFVVWQSVELPSTDPPLLQTTFICGSDVFATCDQNNSMAQLQATENRVTVTFDQIPPVLVQAVVATEDREFFNHNGVDPQGVARALLANLRDDPLKQGGSTITQQYVKNTYLTSERTLDRKIDEAVLAIKLERELSKKEILERYLNTIYFGRGAYGVEAAARAYFGKDVQQLGLPEAAYLAGIIREPEAADANRPSTDPLAAPSRQEATTRRHDVLKAMLDTNYINQAQFDAVDKMGWEYVLPRTAANNYGTVKYADLGSEYVIDYVRKQLEDTAHFTDAQIFGGGLRVYTTIDWNMQKAAYNAISSNLNLPTDPASSIVALDNQGRVKVMVGGSNYKTSQVNLAVGSDGGGGGRQPGSSFKPIALAEALTQGMPITKTYNAPPTLNIKLKEDGSNWHVANYADEGLGDLNLVDMTRESSNTAYAQLIEDVGVKNVTTLAHQMGITADLPEVPSVVLGTGDVSVLDMASVYSTFMDSGEHFQPVIISKVTDAKGNVLYQPTLTPTKVLDPQVASTASWILDQVVESGTGTGAQFGQPVAGKTGTTEHFRDAWFVGYTCQLTAAVWVGYPGAETKYMDDVHGQQVAGGTFPASIFRSFMGPATNGLQSCPFTPPAGVVVPPSTAPTGFPAAGPGTALAPSTTVPFPAFPAPASPSSTSSTQKPSSSSTVPSVPRSSTTTSSSPASSTTTTEVPP